MYDILDKYYIFFATIWLSIMYALIIKEGVRIYAKKFNSQYMRKINTIDRVIVEKYRNFKITFIKVFVLSILLFILLTGLAINIFIWWLYINFEGWCG